MQNERDALCDCLFEADDLSGKIEKLGMPFGFAGFLPGVTEKVR